jgi:hypothetical protein
MAVRNPTMVASARQLYEVEPAMVRYFLPILSLHDRRFLPREPPLAEAFAGRSYQK